MNTGQVTDDGDAWRAVPIPPGQADYLISTAARAPSVQNTQPWRFRVGEYAVELCTLTRAAS
jgi:nitroreductase